MPDDTERHMNPQDATYRRFVKQWEKVTDIPPQTLGPLTPYYRMFVRRVKEWPWPAYIAASAVFVGLLYVLFGPSIARLVTQLQRGF